MEDKEMPTHHQPNRHYTVKIEADSPRDLARIPQALQVLLQIVLNDVQLNLLIEQGTIQLTVPEKKAKQLETALQPIAVKLLLNQFGIRVTIKPVEAEKPEEEDPDAQDTEQFKVSGQVIKEDGKPVDDIMIRAFDRNLRSEDFLGDAVTNTDGRYEIHYTFEQFERAEKGTADLIIRAFNKVGTLLAESDIHFNAPRETVINLTVSKSASIAPSEYELLNAMLTPLLTGVTLSELTERDIWFLTNETNIEQISETFPAGGRSIEFLAKSVRLFIETNLYAEVFYGLARVYFSQDGVEIPDLKDLLAEEPEWWQEGLSKACKGNIIPVRVCERLDEVLKTVERLHLELEPFAPDPVDEHLFFGRLIDRETKEPVAGYLVNAFDLEAGGEPMPLGHAFSNEQGLFALAFTTPKTDKAPESRRLRLIVNTPAGDQIHEQEIAAKTSGTEIIDIIVTLPEAVEPPSPAIGELSEQLDLQIPDALNQFLKERKINTLADIRRSGGLSRMEDLPLTPDNPVIATLEAHANLSVVSSDVAANAALVKQGYSSVHAIAQVPRSKFVTTAQPVIGDFKAAQTQIMARAQTQLATQIMTGIATNVVNGFQPGIFWDGFRIPEWIEQKCGCKDCESAVSPLAYLADLLEYATTHLVNAGTDIDLDFLTMNFHQPFAKLPASCEEMDKRVRQVRICTEVLRSYLKAHPSTAARQNVLVKAEASYRLAAYTTLLNKLGTSFEEIRFARTAKAGSRTALADRLGLTLSTTRPDHLDAIFLDPASGGITEARLESLFGMVNTTRYPLVAGPTPDLQTWKLEHLRILWRQQDWPIDPFTSGTLPLIDPDVITKGNLRKRQGRQVALDLWQARRTWVDNALAAFKADRDANDLDHILKQILGDPLPDIDTLYQNLNNGTDLDNTVYMIKGFHLTAESFRRLMEIKTKEDDPAQNVDNEEWDEVYAILVRARKEAEYPNWIADEQAAALKLSPKGFVPSLAEPALAKWLASQEHRQTWIATLKSRSSGPIIDPDLIDASDLRNPLAANPAFSLWQARRAWITTRLNNRKIVREAAADALAGFIEIVESSLGVSMADLDAIVADQQSGIEIELRLTQLTIERAAFTYLLRIRKLLQERALVLDSEWDAVYSILVQVEKRREFADWRDAEQAQNITLGPDFFRIPDPGPIQFPPLTPDPLPEWRATFAVRRNWQDMLEARIEQEKNTIASLVTAVSEAEAIVLPVLRDALIMATNASGSALDAKAKWVTNKLLIDAKASGCQMTTRISQAINTLQGLLFSVRTRQFNDTYPNLDLDADDFDEEWEWIGSYATWRSAIFAYLYPENILLPSLRRWQTPAFRKLVDETGRNRRLNPDQACKAVREYKDYFRDIATLRVEASCQTRTRLIEGDCRRQTESGWRTLFYMFARGAHTQAAYWSVYDPENDTGYAQTFWAAIPGMAGVIELIGAASYEIAAEQRFIFLFGRRSKSGAQQLIFTKYDLEQRKWDDEPQELELPDEATSFTAVVKQNIHENHPPHLAIRTPNGAIFERKLNRDGSDWEDIGSDDSTDPDSSDWTPTVSELLGRRYSQLCAMVEVASGEYYMVARDPDGVIKYRLFGSRDDAHWRAIPPGHFRGAFSWPGTANMYAFSEGITLGQTYVVVKRSSSAVGTSDISSVKSFDKWLRECTGVSLSQWVIRDGTLFSGLTFYDFFTMQPKDNPYRSRGEFFYIRKTIAYINYIKGQIEGNDKRKNWRIADRMVKQFAENRNLTGVLGRPLSLTDVLERAFKGTATAFKLRSPLGKSEFYVYSGLNGLQYIAPTSGQIQAESPAYSKQFVYLNRHAGAFRTTFTHNNDALLERTPIRIAPRITGPFDIPEHYSEGELQRRKTQIASVFRENEGGPASNFEYIKEAYYFIPVYIGLQLQRRSNFTEALDWFRTVYDYSMPKTKRKIYYGLVKEESLTNSYERAEDWLLDPLNPHMIAATRINSYTRFTLLSIVRCLLEYGDAEFTRDTAESVPRARILYMTALKLLESEDLKLRLGFCSDLAGSLDIEIGDTKWEKVWIAIKVELEAIENAAQLQLTSNNIKAILAGDGSIEERFNKIRAEIEKAKAAQPPVKTLEAVVSEKSQYLAQSHAVVQSAPVFARTIEKAGQVVAQHYGSTVSRVTGIPIQTLEKKETELVWMREPIAYKAMAAAGSGGLALRNDYLEVTGKNPAATSYVAEVADYVRANPASAVKAAGDWLWQYVPAPSFNFCIPTNPIIEALQLRAELNLYKIRTCRNIAGVERELDLYAAPTDTVSGLPTIGAGGQLTLPGAVTFIPTPYRYSIIIERAKQLVSLAQQVEAAFLSALEKRDAEFYNFMKARQDIRTTRAGIRLQDLRIKVAEGEVELSELQKDRAQIQADHYKKLLDQGVSGLELENLSLLAYVSDKQKQVANLHFLAALLPSSVSPSSFPYSPSGIASSIASGNSSIAASLSTTASIMATLASYERRAQEWEFQRTIALQDVKIGSQLVKISEDRLRVVGQERYIATIQAEHAEQTAEFLATKFSNVELYDWMADILEGVYGFFLQQATAMAQLATSQLAFERQEIPPPFIQDDYWEIKEDAVSGGGLGENPVDRRGLTGSARLLQDIYQLDQFSFETDQRKNQITKNISLVSLAPAEFQQFKQTGVLNFATPMGLFDWDFPGDYLRLIKRVRVSVIALIPAIDSIKATLTTTGNSRITVGRDTFQTVNLNRGTEVVALSSPRDDTGLFELQPQLSEKLNPFEGMGVDTQWQFMLPKAANRFDFNSIADVIVTIEYTSLSSFTYRQQVIQQLNNRIIADRPYSFRNQFADQWYDLNNPELTHTPMLVQFDTLGADFPPNIDNLKINHVALYFVRKDGTDIEIPVSHLRFTEKGGKGAVGGGATSIDGVISTRRGNASSWISMIDKSPYGGWELSLATNLPDGRAPIELFRNEEITDILFVITFSGNTPEWPA
jgi:hypothetical protein